MQYDWQPRRDDRYEKYPMWVSRWKHTDIIGAPFSRKLVFYGIQRTIKKPPKLITLTRVTSFCYWFWLYIFLRMLIKYFDRKSWSGQITSFSSRQSLLVKLTSALMSDENFAAAFCCFSRKKIISNANTSSSGPQCRLKNIHYCLIQTPGKTSK